MPRPKKSAPNRADGLYEVKITVDKKMDGSLVRKSFYSSISKEDAKKKANEYSATKMAHELAGIAFLDKQDIAFEKWAKIWLETYKKDKVRQHTYDYTYRVNVEKYLIPYFSNKRLRDIRQVDIQEYFSKSKFALETLKKHRNILSSIYKQAINNDLCYKDPVQDIKLKKETPSEKRAYTFEQYKLLLDYSSKVSEGLPVFILLSTGIRRGELLALTWGDIDFGNKIVDINKAMPPKSNIPAFPKSLNSVRKIPVSDNFIEVLRPLKQKASKYILFDEEPSSDSFIYHYNKFVKKAAEELNIPSLSPHELRHTYGTVLRHNGVDIYTISKVLGHSDISVTAKIYVHNDLDVLRRAMKF